VVARQQTILRELSPGGHAADSDEIGMADDGSPARTHSQPDAGGDESGLSAPQELWPRSPTSPDQGGSELGHGSGEVVAAAIDAAAAQGPEMSRRDLSVAGSSDASPRLLSPVLSTMEEMMMRADGGGDEGGVRGPEQLQMTEEGGGLNDFGRMMDDGVPRTMADEKGWPEPIEVDGDQAAHARVVQGCMRRERALRAELAAER
jgi:hypothetical protein